MISFHDDVEAEVPANLFNYLVLRVDKIGYDWSSFAFLFSLDSGQLNVLLLSVFFIVIVLALIVHFGLYFYFEVIFIMIKNR